MCLSLHQGRASLCSIKAVLTMNFTYLPLCSFQPCNFLQRDGFLEFIWRHGFFSMRVSSKFQGVIIGKLMLSAGVDSQILPTKAFPLLPHRSGYLSDDFYYSPFSEFLLPLLSMASYITLMYLEERHLVNMFLFLYCVLYFECNSVLMLQYNSL